MAHSYKPTDRDQLFLLPPDMREWLGEDHLAWFVLEVIGGLDTRELDERHPLGGAGRQAYDPGMLLALLVYGYCTGERSSRRIEALCQVDIAFRVIAANHRPDHTTIARFRAENEKVIAPLFTRVLSLLGEARLVSVAVVAVDGTKMRANASGRANRTREELEAEARRILEEAAEVDAAEDELYGDRRGDELRPEFADPRTRKAKIAAALKALEEREAAEEAAKEKAGQVRRPRKAVSLEGAEEQLRQAEVDYATRFAEWKTEARAAEVAGERKPPPPDRHRRQRLRRHLETLRAAGPLSPQPTRPVKPLRVNRTDPDSRAMKSMKGYLQGYNAQAAVEENGVIVSAELTMSRNDLGQCQPMMQTTREELDAAGIDEPIGTMLFDAGYCSADNITAPGPDRLIATAKSWKLRKEARANGYAVGEPALDAPPLSQMEHRLLTKEGMALYSRRQVLVEPAFGDLKENLGYRSFVRRGFAACEAEWKLICTAKNLLKLYRCRLGA